MTEYKLGWRPEPADERDLDFQKLVSALNFALADGTQPSVDLRPWCSPVENQLNANACGGNAGVGALELLENLRGDPYVELSRLFLYYNARAEVSEAEIDEGSYMRCVMGSLAKFGICPEIEWPYDTSKVLIRPSWKSYRSAFAHRIKSFYKIFETGNERIERIKAALLNKHPVVFGCKVFEAFKYYKSGKVAMPESSGKLLGGHAMVIVGFDNEESTFIVRNSWGESWGESGYCKMPYAYLEAAEADDFWVPTLAVEYVK